MVVREPTYKKWWLDFQGLHFSMVFFLTMAWYTSDFFVCGLFGALIFNKKSVRFPPPYRQTPSLGSFPVLDVFFFSELRPFGEGWNFPPQGWNFPPKKKTPGFIRVFPLFTPNRNYLTSWTTPQEKTKTAEFFLFKLYTNHWKSEFAHTLPKKNNHGNLRDPPNATPPKK